MGKMKEGKGKIITFFVLLDCSRESCLKVRKQVGPKTENLSKIMKICLDKAEFG